MFCNVCDSLKDILRLLNYYHKCLPNLSPLLNHLYLLLQENVKWLWDTIQEAAFQRAKNLLSSSQLLVHFQKLALSCDALSYGLQAVLSHASENVYECVLQKKGRVKQPRCKSLKRIQNYSTYTRSLTVITRIAQSPSWDCYKNYITFLDKR